MINTKEFYNSLTENGIDFFTGVPDSLLKDICAYITDNTSESKNIIAANEGGAVGIAAGYHLSTGKIPMVYMQNSGIGNTANPLLSLTDPDVYSIPLLLMVGWRGEPGFKDEPQHVKQGEVTTQLFDAMQIPYKILPQNIEDAKNAIQEAVKYATENNAAYALIIQKGTFEPYKLQNNKVYDFEMNREEAIKVIVDNIADSDIIVSTTGKTSRELYEYRDELNQGHEKDFLTVGSMGHASQISLGIALQKPKRQVYCFDGDGAVIMHAGSMAITASLSPENYKLIIFNNGAHDSVGGQPTVAHNIDFISLAESMGFKKAFSVSDKLTLNEMFIEFKNTKGPALLEIKVKKGARKNLGRPKITPQDNKANFMKFLST